MADVEIRKQTANTRGLQDALRAINRAGGTIEIGDKATGGKTLAEFYSKMAFRPVAIDLDHLWEQLGVLRAGGGLTLDDHAPLAAIRGAICGHAQKAV